MQKFSIKQFFSYRNLKRLYYYRLIFPIYRSKKPTAEIALGISIGVFWGMTPTVGIQMYVVLMQWLLHKLFTRFNFDLSLAITMVWISNPFTVVPLYFLFYTTGELIIDLFDLSIPLSGNFILFIHEFNNIYTSQDIGFFQKGKDVLKLMFSSWGVSLMLGSIIYAVFSAVASYYLTTKVLTPLIEKRRLKKEQKKDKLLRIQLMQNFTDEKEITTPLSLIEKKRLKNEVQQKKFVRKQILKDLKKRI